MSNYTPSSQISILGDSGSQKNLSVDESNSLRVNVVSPSTPFGEIAVSRLYPVDQSGFTAGIVSGNFDIYTGYGGALINSSSAMILSTSTDLYSYVAVRTKKYVNYRAGQGTVARFTTAFAEPTGSLLQISGLGHAEDGVFFGYNGNDFGIQYRKFGALQIQKLEITTPSSNTEQIAVVLDGVTYSASVTASSEIYDSAFEISVSGTFDGIWDATAVSGTVYFIPQVGAPGPRNGSYSISGSSIQGNFEVYRSGSAPSTSWITQPNWNIDPMDGSGPSGMILDPTKGNVYQQTIQYLGYGSIKSYIENPETGHFVEVHQIKYANSELLPSFQDPSFSFLTSIASLGSTTSTDMKIGSYGIFSVGEEDIKVNTEGQVVEAAAIGTSLTNIFSIRNSPIRNGKINRNNIKIISIFVAVEGTKPAQVVIYKRPVYAVNPKFLRYSNVLTNTVDVSTDNIGIQSGIVIDAAVLGKSDSVRLDLEKLAISLNRNETLCVAVRATSGTTDVAASVNWYLVG